MSELHAWWDSVNPLWHLALWVVLTANGFVLSWRFGRVAMALRDLDQKQP